MILLQPVALALLASGPVIELLENPSGSTLLVVGLVAGFIVGTVLFTISERLHYS